MADVVVIPDGLLQARRDFLAAQQKLAGLEEDPAAWTEQHGECRRLALAINEHSDWATVEDRKAVRTALDNVTA